MRAALFPAHAGVFPSDGARQQAMETLPRARGGVPTKTRRDADNIVSSPRTRGCSHDRIPDGSGNGLFPAHAGVFPMQPRRSLFAQSLPRARGGVPTITVPPIPRYVSSPRTRGCSQREAPHHAPPRLFPAHAGVFHCLNRYAAGVARLLG
jgi:hypothetical protein